MDHYNLIGRYEQLKERYDDLHRPGPTHQLKDDLGLGSGSFNDRLRIVEVEELIRELEERLASTD